MSASDANPTQPTVASVADLVLCALDDLYDQIPSAFEQLVNLLETSVVATDGSELALTMAEAHDKLTDLSSSNLSAVQLNTRALEVTGHLRLICADLPQ